MTGFRMRGPTARPQRTLVGGCCYSGIVLGAILPWATPLVAQQPILVQPVQQSREHVAPQPPPESLPPGMPSQVLGLAELEHTALAANPAISRASALVGAARGNWVQVGLLPNPTTGYDGQQLGSGGRAEQHGVVFSQEIVRGGKLRLNRAVAEQELAKAQQELAVQQQRVLTDVRISFYQVLLAQRQIDLTESLVQISGQSAKAVDALFRGKEATRADVLQAQLEIENAQVLARNARNRHDAAWRSLAAVVGNPQLPQQALAGDAFAPPRRRLIFKRRSRVCKLQVPKSPWR
jgi:cobalt-zinc-cadmium efflux system outer membrane protein